MFRLEFFDEAVWTIVIFGLVKIYVLFSSLTLKISTFYSSFYEELYDSTTNNCGRFCSEKYDLSPSESSGGISLNMMSLISFSFTKRHI